MKDVSAIILAAGRGTRMKSDLPKVLLTIDGKSMILRSLETLKKVGIGEVIIIVGYKSELVKEEAKKSGLKIKFVTQKELLGTAHSLSLGLKSVSKDTSTILVLFGDDSALFSSNTINEFITSHKKNNNNATFLTSILTDPNPIGALELNEDGAVVGILRQSQIIAKKLREYPILCGAFCFNKNWILKNISKIEKSDLSGEYPLPYIYKVALDQGEFVKTFSLKDQHEWSGVNTPEELKLANIKIKSLHT